MIMLATDDSKAFDIFQKELPDYKIFRISIPEDHNGKNLHYSVKDKKTLVLNLIYDMYMIFNSEYFIPSINSGISRWIIDMIERKNNIFDIDSKCIINF